MNRCLQWIAVASLAACSGGLAERSVVPIQGQLPWPDGLLRLRVELGDGRVEVVAGAAQGIRFRGAVRRAADTVDELRRFEAAGTELTLTADPAATGTFVLRGPVRPEDLRGGVLATELLLDLPPDLPLRVEIAGSGGFVAEHRTADTAFLANRGDVRLLHCVGAALLHTGHGTIIVDDHSGDLDVETGVGDMQVFVRRPGTRLRLVNGLGNVQCYVPPDVGFRVDARAQTGKIANGFGLPVEKPASYSATMVGQRGDGRTEIVLRTGTGHLSLSHKTFAPVGSGR